jgi:hypothetical protein
MKKTNVFINSLKLFSLGLFFIVLFIIYASRGGGERNLIQY